MKKYKSIITVSLYLSVLFLFTFFCWFKKPTPFSTSERRPLQSFPKLNTETVLSVDFMGNFEEYANDQFPFRDKFRTLKAYSSKWMNKSDNNGLFEIDQNLFKLEYPLNLDMIEYASNKFNQIYLDQMKDSQVQVYLSIIPDKNYFIQDSKYLTLDYDLLVEKMKENLPYMHYIDLFSQLELSDYYRSDTHWKQECLIDVANTINQAMHHSSMKEYEMHKVDVDFKGVYLGQSALNVQPDELYYLTNSLLENCKVYSYSSNEKKEIPLYNMDKAFGKDSYEMFLNGSEALIEIENPQAKSNQELVIFRDSFGSSLSPLLIQDYSKIQIVDIRYMQSQLLKNYIQFDDQDVLFIYSTLVLNQSTSLK